MDEELLADPLVLRRWHVDDAEALGRAVSESLEHLRPWMPWVAQEPVALERRRALLASWDEDWSAGSNYNFGFFLDGAVVGGGGLRRRVDGGGIEIGYWVHRDHVGRGFATLSAAALTDAALAALDDVERVEIHHDVANIASGRVPARLGYELVQQRPDGVIAPGESGTECVWVVRRSRWQGVDVYGSGRDPEA